MVNKSVGADLSIIVPVGGDYKDFTNLRSWIPEAINLGIEVIVVLDTDNMEVRKLIEDIKVNHKSIQVKNSSHRNPGDSRNIGIESSSRNWLAFTDADDYVHLHPLLTALKECMEQNKEIAVTQFSRVKRSGKAIISRENNFPQLSLDDLTASPGLWRFIFKRHRVGETRFPSLSMAEDQIFLAELNLNTNEIYFSQKYTYDYSIGNFGQLTTNKRSSEALRQALNYFKKLESSNSDFGRQLYLRNIITALKISSLSLRLKLIRDFVRISWNHPLSVLSIFAKIVAIQRQIYVWRAEGSVIILTGGLGNQLYQAALATSLLPYTKITFDISTGKPRLNKDLNPEIMSFELPAEFNFKNYPRLKLRQKSLGYILRSSYNPRKFEDNYIFRSSLNLIGNCINSVIEKRLTQVICPQNLGWDPKFSHRLRKKQTIYGYFQSSNFFGKNPEILSLRLKNESQDLTNLKELALVEKPLILHVRLGDYRTESNFGTLDKFYFSKAIDLASKECMFQHVWVFTDEPESVHEFIEIPDGIQCRVIANVGDSPSESLELMRYGKCFVIGNSTFSWWGAYLRYDRNARVLGPNPWFKGPMQPNAILPLDWIKVESSYTGK